MPPSARPLGSLVWPVAGATVVVVAAGTTFLVADGSLGRSWALAAVAGQVAVLPLMLTGIMIRGFQRLDSGAKFWRSVPGMAVVAAVLSLVAVAVFARPGLARALAAAPRRHRGVPAFVGSLGRFIAPAKAMRHRAAPNRPGPQDAGAARQRVAVVDAVEPPPLVPGPGPAPPPTTREEPRRQSAIAVCEEGWVGPIGHGNLGHGPGDELAVSCGGWIRVLWLVPEGKLIERTRYVVDVPEGQEAQLAQPRLVDADQDGRLDLLACAYTTSERGGTRGGNSWWSRGRPDGQLAPPTRLVGSFCAAIDAGDVDGDGQSELVVVHRGNPWLETQPNGELRWYERSGLRWTQRGRAAVGPSPVALLLLDVDSDGRLDAVVDHEGEEAVVCRGSPRGLEAVDGSLEAPPLPPRDSVTARLDGDDLPDSVRASPGPALHFELTAPDWSAPTGPIDRAPDFVEYHLR